MSDESFSHVINQQYLYWSNYFLQNGLRSVGAGSAPPVPVEQKYPVNSTILSEDDITSASSATGSDSASAASGGDSWVHERRELIADHSRQVERWQDECGRHLNRVRQLTRTVHDLEATIDRWVVLS